jgi:hypothetical protein
LRELEEIRKRLHEFEEIHKKLREFKEIDISGKTVKVTVNSKEENSLKTFDWILSKNSASGKELISKNRKTYPNTALQRLY